MLEKGIILTKRKILPRVDTAGVSENLFVKRIISTALQYWLSSYQQEVRLVR